MKYAILIIIGLVIGFLLSQQFQKEKVTIKTVTEIKTDTVYIEIRDTIRLTETDIEYRYLRDTIINDFKPIISHFKTSFPLANGNIYFQGEIMGKLLKTSFTTDFKVPTVTNTITNTTTIIKKPSGLFLTAGIGSNFSAPYIGAIFIKDKYLLGLNSGGFQVGYKIGR